MAFGASPQFYPRQFTRTANLTTTAGVIFPAGSRRTITHLVVRSLSATPRIITLRGAGGGPTIFIVAIPSNVSIEIPGWMLDKNGLEALTDNATGAQNITVHYTSGTLGAS